VTMSRFSQLFKIPACSYGKTCCIYIDTDHKALQLYYKSSRIVKLPNFPDWFSYYDAAFVTLAIMMIIICS